MVIPVAVPSGSVSSTAEADQAWAQVQPERGWAELGAAAKYERILCAAGALFAKRGLNAPMPAVAVMAGASVGSLYRQFPSKRELLAALVIRRLEQISEAAADAATRVTDHWQALTEMLWTLLEQQAADDFLGDAWIQVQDHEQVLEAAAVAYATIDRLLDLARAEGKLRSDADSSDVRLLFVAARASRQVDRRQWQRMLTLMLHGLAARQP